MFSLFAAADDVFFGFALLFDSSALTGELLLYLLSFLQLLIRKGIIELLFQENFPLGQLALVDAVDLSEAGFLLGRQRSRGRRIRFRQTFHGQFVSTFHKRRKREVRQIGIRKTQKVAVAAEQASKAMDRPGTRTMKRERRIDFRTTGRPTAVTGLYSIPSTSPKSTPNRMVKATIANGGHQPPRSLAQRAA